MRTTRKYHEVKLQVTHKELTSDMQAHINYSS